MYAIRSYYDSRAHPGKTGSCHGGQERRLHRTIPAWCLGTGENVRYLFNKKRRFRGMEGERFQFAFFVVGVVVLLAVAFVLGLSYNFV